jgi:hypothetical protein
MSLTSLKMLNEIYMMRLEKDITEAAEAPVP